MLVVDGGVLLVKQVTALARLAISAAHASIGSRGDECGRGLFALYGRKKFPNLTDDGLDHRKMRDDVPKLLMHTILRIVGAEHLSDSDSDREAIKNAAINLRDDEPDLETAGGPSVISYPALAIKETCCPRQFLSPCDHTNLLSSSTSVYHYPTNY